MIKILVLTDKENIGSLIKSVAEGMAEDVFTVDYSENINSIYQEYQPDIILLDLQRDNMDGDETLNYLALHYSNSAIVLMSEIQGEVTDATIRFGVAMGLNMGGVLTKPIGPDDLKATLYTYLGMNSGSK